MTNAQLRSFLRHRPFVPFIIHMADGRSVEVKHPETIAYDGGRIAIVLTPDEGFEIIDVFLVTSIQAAFVPGGGDFQQQAEPV